MGGPRGATRGLYDLFYVLACSSIASGSFQRELGDAENDGYLIADLVDKGVGQLNCIGRFFTLMTKVFAGEQIL
jgi:hypothetical protein